MADPGRISLMAGKKPFFVLEMRPLNLKNMLYFSILDMMWPSLPAAEFR